MAIFTFNDIVALNDEGLRCALYNFDYFTLLDALKTADEPARDKVCGILPKNTAARLKDALENAGDPNREESEKAQMDIIRAIKPVNDRGQHDIQKGGDFTFPDSPKVEAADAKSRLTEYIEKVCGNKGRKLLLGYATEDNIRKGFEAFQTRQDELARIRSLSVSGEQLPVVCEYIAADKIEELWIGKCDDASHWASLEKFTGLKELTIAETACIPENIGRLQSLTKLALISNKEINALPESIGDLKNLARLEIHGAPFSAQFPDSIGRLQSLKQLWLYNYRTPPGSPEIERLDWICDLRSLTALWLYCLKDVKALPDDFGNLKNLEHLSIAELSSLERLPECIGDLQSLTNLSLFSNEKIKVLPESMGRLEKLTELSISRFHSLERLPESIGKLQSLKRFLLEDCEKIEALPESLGDLKKLTDLEIKNMPSLEKLPESIGGLQALTGLFLEGNEKLASLPDGIGRLENLRSLTVSHSPSFKHLPESLANLAPLEYASLFGTGVEKVPQSVSSAATFIDMKPIAIIPKQGSISYRGFVNAYYKIMMIVSRFREKAKREGLLTLEEELDTIEEGFFVSAVRLVLDGTDEAIVRQLLTLHIEREHGFYRKKLMGIAMEGVLGIQAGEDTTRLILRLNLMVDIKDNPINAAHEKYFRGDRNAFLNIDFASAIRPEVEREEVSMIKRAVEMSELARREGIFALEKHLDAEAIAAGDVLECGLSMIFIVENRFDLWARMNLGTEYISATLDRLVERAIDPVQKKLALAKKEAVLSICAGENTRIFTMKMLAYVDKDVAKTIEDRLLRD